jgi:hypothetical protein
LLIEKAKSAPSRGAEIHYAKNAILSITVTIKKRMKTGKKKLRSCEEQKEMLVVLP